MSHLQYFVYPGAGEVLRDKYGYSQAVKIGDRIECSGQGGWDPQSFAIASAASAQIEQAFANVELALKTAGGNGWAQVYKVVSYHVPLDDEAFEVMHACFRRYMPDHRPLWTAVAVPALALEAMKVEIEVVAHVETVQ